MFNNTQRSILWTAFLVIKRVCKKDVVYAMIWFWKVVLINRVLSDASTQLLSMTKIQTGFKRLPNII